MYDVSVVIPNYNGAAFLKKAIDSALNQNGVDVEVVVVDDGSTDSSREILENYGNRIKVFYQANKGAPAARNLGIAKSTADLIKFLDSDDVLGKDALQVELELTRNSPLRTIYFGDIVYINSDGQVIDASLKLRSRLADESNLLYFLKNNPLTSSPLHKRFLLEEINGFRDLPKGQEWDLHLRLFLNGTEFRYHQNFVYQFRIHEAEKRYSNLRLTKAGRFCFLKIFDEQLDRIMKVFPQLSIKELQFLSTRYYNYGRAIFREGEREEASVYFKRAFELGGKDAIPGGLMYRIITRLTNPFAAERVLDFIKKIIR